MFKKMSLENKFTAITVAFVALLLFITSVVFFKIDELGRMNDRVVDEDLVKLSAVKEAMNAAKDNAIATSEYFFTTDKSR